MLGEARFGEQTLLVLSQIVWGRRYASPLPFCGPRSYGRHRGKAFSIFAPPLFPGIRGRAELLSGKPAEIRAGGPAQGLVRVVQHGDEMIHGCAIA